MFHLLPATTLSIACSKWTTVIDVLRSRAAIRAASLQTLAMSAPVKIQVSHCWDQWNEPKKSFDLSKVMWAKNSHQMMIVVISLYMDWANDKYKLISLLSTVLVSVKNTLNSSKISINCWFLCWTSSNQHNIFKHVTIYQLKNTEKILYIYSYR